MKVRTWPIGTRYKAQVVTASRTILMVAGMSPGAAGEGFALINHGLQKLPREKAMVEIVFAEGGPTGGYWKLDKIL